MNFQSPMEKILCNYLGASKRCVILFLAINNRLLTRDGPSKCMNISDLKCLLCCVENVPLEHLLFQCSYAYVMWEKFLWWKRIKRRVVCWTMKVDWAINYAKDNTIGEDLYRPSLTYIVYALWKKRNNRICQSQCVYENLMVRQIIQEVHNRGTSYSRLGEKLKNLNYYS